MLAYGPIPFWKDGRGPSAHRGVHSFLQLSNPPPALLSLRAADLGPQLPQCSMSLLSFLLPICVLVAQHARLFMTSWTVNHQAPLSIEFLRQEYWSKLPFPLPGDLLDPGVKHTQLVSPALAGGFFTTRATWEAPITKISVNKNFPFSKHVSINHVFHSLLCKVFFTQLKKNQETSFTFHCLKRALYF